MGDLSVWPFWLSLAIFVITYVGILSERVHRTIASLVGAVAMVVFGTWLGFYSEGEAIDAIAFDTIFLLLGMMLIVGLFKETGFFQYLAIRTAKFAKGKPWLLMVYLGLVTSLVSMVLDNVTTIIIIIPVTISMTDILGIPVLPFLMSEVLLSNIGGVATLIGDPPNILIGSAAGFSFTDFLTHLAPIVLVTWLVIQTMLLLIFRGELRQTAGSLDKLSLLDAKRALVDPKTAKRMLIIIGIVILLFLVHDKINLHPGAVALIGAALGLLWVRPPLEEILREVHWDVLLFFISLFVVVGGLEAAGVLDLIADGITNLTSHGPVLAALAVLWIGAIMSGLIDRIPFTIAMLPIIAGLASRGVNVAPLWWALALGVGFGANGTPIGSMANVVTVSISEQMGTPITFRTWVKSGSLIAIIACVIGSIALILAIKLGLL